MEDMRPVTLEEYDAFPLPDQRKEPGWDPEKAARRKVRVIKVPYDLDPMKEHTIFEFQGFVYICYAKKTRGRSMIRCLGLADIAPPVAKVLPEEMTAAIKDERVEYGLGDGIRESIDKDIIDNIAKEAEGDG